MPWTPKDVAGKTHKAKTPADKAEWVRMANAILEKTGSESSAIRIANAHFEGRRKPAK